MTSTAIKLLMDEHEIISEAEDIIVMLDKYWEKDKANYEKCVRLLIQFFRDFCDKYHHQKEEEVLFLELKDHHDFRMSEMLDELQSHHDDFRHDIIDIETAINDEDYEKAHSLLISYINGLLDHIAIEDDELFVMAESLFTEDQLDIIYHKCKDIDQELGDQRKLELISIVKKIEEVLME